MSAGIVCPKHLISAPLRYSNLNSSLLTMKLYCTAIMGKLSSKNPLLSRYLFPLCVYQVIMSPCKLSQENLTS